MDLTLPFIGNFIVRWSLGVLPAGGGVLDVASCVGDGESTFFAGSSAMSSTAGWKPPDAGFFKLNVDAAGCFKLEVAEAKAILKGLKLSRRRFEPLLAESDALNVINLCVEVISGRRNREQLESGFDGYFPLLVANTVQNGEDDRPTMGQVVQILEGVSEVSIPPMPRFLQRLAEIPPEVVLHQEASSTPDSWA
ncbi:hypothetical protein JRO89_XS01G0179300 [Xanthoceras sorbifolium]|uniref:Uncharacterized protein n=1 Tax=Xanthoceras sorbifolium TaxID=99658 RepID=A0ABQ8IKG0_9ROSI|nr:hypothetical protein JRO89_XS01G0179300 [Xanthoceras sorbifolium]